MSRFAGIHWPNGPEDYARIMALPSPLILMLATEARYHYDKVRKAGKTVIWRGLPRVGRRPAELGWTRYSTNATEALNLWDEQPHYGEEWFVPYNELDLNFERGDNENDFTGIPERIRKIATFLDGVRLALRGKLPDTVKILFSPFTPDHGDIENVALWEEVAKDHDGLVVHAYADPGQARERLVWYLERFPNHPIYVGEWNSDDPRAFIEMLADLQSTYSNFRGATYFAWHWYGAPGYWPAHYDVDRNPDLYALLKNPPQEEKPIMNPWEFFSANQIARVSQCPQSAVEENWPRLVEQLTHCGINDRATQIAMIGTVAIESASTFRPVKEAFFLGEPEPAETWRRNNLRYYPWYGRGFIQITWESNYKKYSDAVNELWQAGGAINLVADRSQALDPDVSAAISALYFLNHGGDGLALIPRAARQGNWREVRRLVQGGDHGLGRLEQIARDLGALVEPGEPTGRVYGPDVPDSVILQQNGWSCAVRSTYAALWAMAQEGVTEGVTYGDGGPRDVYNLLVPTYDSSAAGLKDHSGAGLVQALSRWGIKADYKGGPARGYASLAEVQARAGNQPVLLGGVAWNHWVYVRGVEDDGTLILENPAPGHSGIRHQLLDSFGRLGPMSMVWIDVEPVQPPEFQFHFGFLDLANRLGRGVVGDPTMNEQAMVDDNRYNVQKTTKGLMIYSKAANESYFLPG